MNKYNTVKKNKDFNNIIQTGTYIKNDYYILYFKNSNLEKYRFGVSVGTKVGNAVTRNKLKRKVRCIIDLNKKYYQNYVDYIIIVRKTCLIASFEDMTNKFIDLFNRKDKYEK